MGHVGLVLTGRVAAIICAFVCNLTMQTLLFIIVFSGLVSIAIAVIFELRKTPKQETEMIKREDEAMSKVPDGELRDFGRYVPRHRPAVEPVTSGGFVACLVNQDVQLFLLGHLPAFFVLSNEHFKRDPLLSTMPSRLSRIHGQAARAENPPPRLISNLAMAQALHTKTLLAKGFHVWSEEYRG